MRLGPRIVACLDSLCEGDAGEIWLDLKRCQRLDSTFAGCLLGFSQEARRGERPKLILNRVSHRCMQALEKMRLDKMMSFQCEEPPELDWSSFEGGEADRDELTTAVISAHERLAACDPENDDFARVARVLSEDYERRNKSPQP